MTIEKTLNERGARYGDFTDHARLCQKLKQVMQTFSIPQGVPGIITASVKPWEKLAPVQKQALEVIADKIARILSGDPNYADNWHDIQGYARLVEERLPGAALPVYPAVEVGVDVRFDQTGRQEAVEQNGNDGAVYPELAELAIQAGGKPIGGCEQCQYSGTPCDGECETGDQQ